ncbi:MAG TPA: glycogen synthase GlgA [Chthoniobacteraceae bacterium]|jgi:starch synthase
MKILLAGSELTPLARTGGLGDVLEALPGALVAAGHEVSVVLPCYRGFSTDRKLKPRSTGVKLGLQVGGKRVEAEILDAKAANGVQLFLVKQDEYFDRAGIYGEDGRDYEDNAERFIFFSKAVVELARRVSPPPDIIQVHDWQTALVPVLVKERRLPVTTVLTIHNLAYQGSFWALDFGLTNLPGEYFSPRGVEFYGRLNLLKAGILFADAVTTVSERYAREIQTPEYGCGLDAVIREHAGKLHGILNGADYAVWDPANDKLLPKRYKSSNLAGKKTCRDALLKACELAPDPQGPVFAMVSRLAEQKGLDLLLPLLDRLLADDVRLVILGEGDTAYERELMIASKRHREHFAYWKTMDEPVAHLIQAGADVALIPSHFEPCGLTAMYSLRYGTLPIARATGGLHQIVQDFDPTLDSGHGLLFYDYTPQALWDSINRAKRLRRDPALWKRLVQRAMEMDFSWKVSVEKYTDVYRRALGRW